VGIAMANRNGQAVTKGDEKSIRCSIIKKLPQFDISLVASKKGVVVTSHRNPI